MRPDGHSNMSTRAAFTVSPVHTRIRVETRCFDAARFVSPRSRGSVPRTGRQAFSAHPVLRAVANAPFCCAAPPSHDGSGVASSEASSEVRSHSSEVVEKHGEDEGERAVGDAGSRGGSGDAGHGHRGNGDGDGGGGDSSDGGRGESSDGGDNVIGTALGEGKHIAEVALGNIGHAATYLFKFVPPQVLTALIGLLSGYGAQQRNNRIKERDEKKSKEEERKRKVAESERHLRELYDNNHGPLLKAAAKLSERIYVLVSGQSDWEDDAEAYNGTVYSAFLLGKYLAYVEHIKRNSQETLNLGFPAADRIFLNILGRIQSSLAASDAALAHIQSTEESFKASPGTKPYLGGPFTLTPRSQSAIGELMLRKLRCEGRGPADILSFNEFAEQMDASKELRKWMTPVINELSELRKAGKVANKMSRNGVPYNKQVVVKTTREAAAKHLGARAFLIQNALVDLIEFLDPAPFKTIRPDYRKRLNLSHSHPAEQLRMPPALHALYTELGKIRDHKVSRDEPNRAFKGKPIEIFVKAASGTGPRGIRAGQFEYGDCPYSQRVAMSLHMLGVPFNVVPVDITNKPGWFHVLSGEAQVPVMFSSGTLISESRHIMSYLIDKFPDKCKTTLGPSVVGNVRLGTMAYTRFYPAFHAALGGRPGAVESLQTELRALNETMSEVQEKCKKGVFLGGKTFSREDTSIVPMLHAVDIAGPALKGKAYGIPEDCTALKTYLKAARAVPCFAETSPRDAVTVDGYRSLVDKEKKARTARPWMQDMLE